MKKMNAMLAVGQQIIGQASQNMYGQPGLQGPNPDAEIPYNSSSYAGFVFS